LFSKINTKQSIGKKKCTLPLQIAKTIAQAGLFSISNKIASLQQSMQKIASFATFAQKAALQQKAKLPICHICMHTIKILFATSLHATIANTSQKCELSIAKRTKTFAMTSKSKQQHEQNGSSKFKIGKIEMHCKAHLQQQLHAKNAKQKKKTKQPTQTLATATQQKIQHKKKKQTIVKNMQHMMQCKQVAANAAIHLAKIAAQRQFATKHKTKRNSKCNLSRKKPSFSKLASINPPTHIGKLSKTKKFAQIICKFAAKSIAKKICQQQKTLAQKNLACKLPN